MLHCNDVDKFPSGVNLATSFPQFAKLPVELQDLIWDHAATGPGLRGVHFFHQLEPTFAKWTDWDMLLVPDRQSAALNLVHLSWTCRAARDAALRRNRAPGWNKTILRILSFQTPAGYRKMLNLTLDLGNDLVCFGSPDAGYQETSAALDWGEWTHIIFSSARHFAIRYQPEWASYFWASEGDGGLDRSIASLSPMFQQQQQWWPASCVHTSWSSGIFQPNAPFCARCLVNVLCRFDRLESFYLVVDRCCGPAQSFRFHTDCKPKGPLMTVDGRGRRTFHSYSRTYFELDESDASRDLIDPMMALRAIRANLVRYFRPRRRNADSLAREADCSLDCIAELFRHSEMGKGPQSRHPHLA